MSEQLELDCVTNGKLIEELLERVSVLEEKQKELEEKLNRRKARKSNKRPVVIPPEWDGKSPFVMILKKEKGVWELKLEVPESFATKDGFELQNCTYEGGNLIQFEESGKMKFRKGAHGLYETTNAGEKVQTFCKTFKSKRIFCDVKHVENCGFLMGKNFIAMND